MHGIPIAETDDDFTRPSAERVSGLTAGCYVRVRNGKGCCWVEITEANGEFFVGRVHAELATPDCQLKDDSLKEVEFNKYQIVALGCDRYCFC